MSFTWSHCGYSFGLIKWNMRKYHMLRTASLWQTCDILVFIHNITSWFEPTVTQGKTLTSCYTGNSGCTISFWQTLWNSPVLPAYKLTSCQCQCYKDSQFKLQMMYFCLGCHLVLKQYHSRQQGNDAVRPTKPPEWAADYDQISQLSSFAFWMCTEWAGELMQLSCTNKSLFGNGLVF